LPRKTLQAWIQASPEEKKWIAKAERFPPNPSSSFPYRDVDFRGTYRLLYYIPSSQPQNAFRKHSQ
jgi:hypothetical protein